MILNNAREKGKLGGLILLILITLPFQYFGFDEFRSTLEFWHIREDFTKKIIKIDSTSTTSGSIEGSTDQRILLFANVLGSYKIYEYSIDDSVNEHFLEKMVAENDCTKLVWVNKQWFKIYQVQNNENLFNWRPIFYEKIKFISFCLAIPIFLYILLLIELIKNYIQQRTKYERGF